MSAATGEENSSFFSPASAMLSVWAMCGGSRTCVTRTAEVSARDWFNPDSYFMLGHLDR